MPAEHYLGARMMQTMEQIHPRSLIMGCAQNLHEFLPLYNDAANKTGEFVFDTQLIQQFVHLWET